MKKRLRKKLQLKEFRIQEWFIGFTFKHILSEIECDKFWDDLCNFVDSQYPLFYGGGTNLRAGNFVFFGDPPPHRQVTKERATIIFKWFTLNEFVATLEMHNITYLSEEETDKLFMPYQAHEHKEDING